MLSHFDDRLKEAMAAKWPTIKDFSEATGIPYPSLREYISGKKKPGMDALAAISSASGVSTDWLLTGEGSKFRGQAISSDPDSETLCKTIEGLELLLKSMRRELPAEKKARIIVMLYRSFVAQHQVDPAMIREMIELAA